MLCPLNGVVTTGDNLVSSLRRSRQQCAVRVVSAGGGDWKNRPLSSLPLLREKDKKVPAHITDAFPRDAR